MKTLVTTLLFLTLGMQHMIGQNISKDSNPKKMKLSIEIDPATFFMKGYGIHLRLQPKNCNHLLYGVGIYGLDLPDVLVDFNEKNKNKGWNVRIQQGFSLFGEHHFKDVNKAWFVGMQAGIQKFKLTNDHSPKETSYSNILTMAYAGYTFNPFNNGLYLKPWFGLGYTSKISGDHILDNDTYNIAPITYFATLHIGYTF